MIRETYNLLVEIRDVLIEIKNNTKQKPTQRKKVTNERKRSDGTDMAVPKTTTRKKAAAPRGVAK